MRRNIFNSYVVNNFSYDCVVNWYSSDSDERADILDSLNKKLNSMFSNVRLLEISDNSSMKLGRFLSFNNLSIYDGIELNKIFEMSKVFSGNVMNNRLLDLNFLNAKNINSLKSIQTRFMKKNNLALIGFKFEDFSLDKSDEVLFKNYLYIRGLDSLVKRLKDEGKRIKNLNEYNYFIDLDNNALDGFNQARGMAIYSSLVKNNLLEAALESPFNLKEILNNSWLKKN